MPRACKLRLQVSDADAAGQDAPYRDLPQRLGVVIFRADEGGRRRPLELSQFGLACAVGLRDRRVDRRAGTA